MGDDARAANRGGLVEELIFGTADERAVRDAVDGLCRAELGSAVRVTLFRRTSAGVVSGVELEDGRRVVVKAHQPRQSREFLQVVFQAQKHLADQGFPCPRPLTEPRPLGKGFARIEKLVETGGFADAHVSSIRKAMALALLRLLELTRPLGKPQALRKAWSLWEGDGVWPPTAHSPIFDFASTTGGAEWIDELAREARAAIPATGEELIVHTDWSGKHFRFGGDGRIAVIYDWDSLALETEIQALGTAAATFTANFELDVPAAPTPDEVAAFIDEYSASRRTPLSSEHVSAAHAVATYLVAYTARCEHALGRRGDFTDALARFARGYLARG